MSEKPKFLFALREDLQEEKRFLPTKAEPFATGWDVRSAQKDKRDIILRAGQFFKIPLGFRVMPQEGWWLQLHPRSSSFTKKCMHNLIGIIDEHFFLEPLFVGQYIPDVNFLGKDIAVKFGDSIGQIIPIKRQEMEIIEVSNKEYNDLCERKMAIRKGGFGSTDKS